MVGGKYGERDRKRREEWRMEGYRIWNEGRGFFISTHCFRRGHVRCTGMMDIGYMHEHFMAITSVQNVPVETHMIGTSGDTQCRGLFRSFNYTGVTTLVQTSFGYYTDLMNSKFAG